MPVKTPDELLRTLDGAPNLTGSVFPAEALGKALAEWKPPDQHDDAPRLSLSHLGSEHADVDLEVGRVPVFLVLGRDLVLIGQGKRRVNFG